MLAVVSVALPVFALILTGVLAGWRGFLGKDVTGVLNLFVVYLALPAVLFQAMAHIDPANLLNGGMLATYGLGALVPFVLALWWSRHAKDSLGDAAMQALSATYANVGYMGIPLCRTAFGDASLAPAVITLVITACPQFALGLTLMELDRPGQPGLWLITRRILRALGRNPLLIAPISGLAVAVLGLPVPLAFDRFLSLLGGAATPCALVATGLMLGETTERFQLGVVARLVVLKLLVQPAVTWFIGFRLVSLPPMWGETAVLMSALPTGAGAFILAKLYGRGSAATSGTVLVSTVLSFGTLSVLLAWLM